MSDGPYGRHGFNANAGYGGGASYGGGGTSYAAPSYGQSYGGAPNSGGAPTASYGTPGGASYGDYGAYGGAPDSSYGVRVVFCRSVIGFSTYFHVQHRETRNLEIIIFIHTRKDFVHLQHFEVAANGMFSQRISR